VLGQHLARELQAAAESVPAKNPALDQARRASLVSRLDRLRLLP
jgi:hypothetical protein